ncbi:MAG: glycoside hydrolase family 9 protein [Clostridiales bacterium]|jgi:hypothetical protein|nr:glycoside hydrolase family 9 protein [Clostridiales bacterium]
MDKKLIESLYIHRPLPPEAERSLEFLNLKKPVLAERPLSGSEDIKNWRASGIGTLTQDGGRTPAGGVILRLQLPTVMPHWPEDNPKGDYTPYGRQRAEFKLNGEDWRAFNRVHFWLRPDCPGARAVSVTFFLVNDGAEKVPDPYGREGSHEVNLINREWNECALEIPTLPRDCVTCIGFSGAAFGMDRSMGDYLRFDIGEISLQKVAEPEIDHGWLPSAGGIAYSMTGYFTDGRKIAVTAGGADAPAFFLKNKNGETVYEGTAEAQKTPLGAFTVLDFSGFQTEGEYSLCYGGAETEIFRIGADIFTDSIWKAINFIFCERCGYPVPEKHGVCHCDILAEHEGVKLVYNGGWHDAGDLSQQTLQTADVVYSLLEMAERVKTSAPPLYARLLEEAEWGLDFVLKCRFGDGYRASSAGIVHWSDGFIGNRDDRPVRVQNNSFDNFLYAAYEGYAARVLPDKMLCEKLTAAAVEDYDFALARFLKAGCDDFPVFWEHTYPTSESLYMAARSFAASQLYRLTGKERYAFEAADCAGYLQKCQCAKPVGEAKLEGFFYRNWTKKVIQHANHQSREQLYMQALAALLETQPEHPDAKTWRESMRKYGDFLKKSAKFVLPYGMLPSGVYHIGEAEDEKSFSRQHLYTGAEAKENYPEQLKQGTPLDDAHYFKIFPVWFSFRGNSAVHLASGKAAAVCAKILGDGELRDIAREQLYWVVGKNPFRQSLMYGEGSRYAEQAVFLPGTMTGQLPVGVQTKGNEDVPYWPQCNNATYKEAWLTVAGKWLSLLAELN